MGHPLWKNPRPSHPPVGTSRFQYLGVNVSPKLKDLFHLNFSPLLKKNFYVGIYVSFNFNNINAHSVPRTCIIHNTLRAWQDVKTICGSRVGVFMLAPNRNFINNYKNVIWLLLNQTKLLKEDCLWGCHGWKSITEREHFFNLQCSVRTS